VQGNGCVASFFDSIAIEVVPRVLSDSAGALVGMVRLIMTSWYSRPVADRLLDVNFVCNFLWAGKDVGETIYKAVQRRGIGIMKNFSVDGFWAFVIELLVFRYSFFNLLGGIVGRDFAGFVFSVFGDSS
jgi:hypothetical protein